MLEHLIVGFFGGLHRACWGAYKDSPFEDFSKTSFFRSLFLGSFWGLFLYFFLPFVGVERSEYSLVNVFLMSLVLDTIVLEFYKLFFRKEKQDKYLIPSRFNILGKRVSNIMRIIVGVVINLVVFGAFYLWFKVDLNIESTVRKHITTFILGFIFGVFEAFGGSWKDAPFEGFEPLKFFRSPLISAFWATILSSTQMNLAVLLLSTGGATRMTVELHKAFLKGYKSGKFKSDKPVFKFWAKNRKLFFPYYIFTWIIYIFLLIDGVLKVLF